MRFNRKNSLLAGLAVAAILAGNPALAETLKLMADMK